LLLARGLAETPRLDTLSYFDETEPNWNERPFFEKVEEKRGSIGCHVDISAQRQLLLESAGFSVSPGANPVPSQRAKSVAECLVSHGIRVVLSGNGGDEVLGGVPTPVPELADLLVRARFGTLAHQLKEWSLQKRKPWLHLGWETISSFLPPTLGNISRERRPPGWLDPAFVKRHWTSLTGYPRRMRLFGPLPSFQENLVTLEGLRRQLGCTPLSKDPAYDKAYPYLDRELLEFAYAIPREQILRPGQRRSLMRRALAGIVPDEILCRRRKAFIARGPTVAIARESEGLMEFCREMIASSLRIVDSKQFQEALQRTRHGAEISLVAFDRTLSLELWLRELAARRVVNKLMHRTNIAARPICESFQVSLPR
jgi:asparagine synthase (glutamine-hydrolysing)